MGVEVNKKIGVHNRQGKRTHYLESGLQEDSKNMGEGIEVKGSNDEEGIENFIKQLKNKKRDNPFFHIYLIRYGLLPVISHRTSSTGMFPALLNAFIKSFIMKGFPFSSNISDHSVISRSIKYLPVM